MMELDFCVGVLVVQKMPKIEKNDIRLESTSHMSEIIGFFSFTKKFGMSLFVEQFLFFNFLAFAH